MDQRQPTMVARPGTFSIPLAATTVQHHYQQSPPQPQHTPVQQQQRQAPLPPAPPPRAYYTQEPADPQKMEQSYSRSVTIVYWHKAGNEPVRIRREIPTFPWFQLAQLTDIVNEVGLSPSTYVDAYNPAAGTWEQETIAAVRCVESEQRLLYRSRKSLLEGLADRDCPGLEHEIKLQPPGMQQVLRTKRPLPEQSPPESSMHPNKQLKVSHVSFPSDPAQAHVYSQALPPPHGNGVSVPSPSMNHASVSAVMGGPVPGPVPTPVPPEESPYLQHEQQLAAQSSPDPTGGGGGGEGFTPHPPLKRWPNDYAVCEIAAGLAKMDELVNQTPSLTQKAAFERVFGCRYVKSTVCRHRGVWRKADKNLRESFERMGTDERALWGEFVKRTDFRRDKGAKTMQVHDQMHDHDVDEQQQQQQQHQQVQQQQRPPPQHHLEYGMGPMGSLGLGLVDPAVGMGVNGGMDDGLNGNQSPMGALGPQG